MDRLTIVFTRLRPRLLAVARRLLPQGEEPEDAVQDAFCRLWPRRESLDDDDSHAQGASLVTLRNVCIDRSRHAAGTQTQSLDQDYEQTPAECGWALDQDDADEQTRRLERLDALARQRLSPRDRQILYRREMDGWTYDDLAEHYAMTPTAVRAVISRARRTLRKFYEENH